MDGRAALDPPGLNAPGVADELWRRHQAPEFIIVGVANGASTLESTNPLLDRASEFLPYPDPSWIDEPKPAWRGGLYPAFLVDEIMPEVDRRYRTNVERAATIVAGSSYSGVAALVTGLVRADRVGALLLQSPSAHVGSGQLLADIANAQLLPDLVYVDVGDHEGETPEWWRMSPRFTPPWRHAA